MKIDYKIKDEKLQYNINREVAKISALSSGKIDKYEYLTGEEILPSSQSQIIEQAKITYSPFGKASEKQIKSIEDAAEQQAMSLQTLNIDQWLKPIGDLFSTNILTIESKDYIEKIKNIGQEIHRDDLIDKTSTKEKSKTYGFQKFKQ